MGSERGEEGWKWYGKQVYVFVFQPQSLSCSLVREDFNYAPLHLDYRRWEDASHLSIRGVFFFLTPPSFTVLREEIARGAFGTEHIASVSPFEHQHASVLFSCRFQREMRNVDCDVQELQINSWRHDLSSVTQPLCNRETFFIGFQFAISPIDFFDHSIKR